MIDTVIHNNRSINHDKLYWLILLLGPHIDHIQVVLIVCILLCISPGCPCRVSISLSISKLSLFGVYYSAYLQAVIVGCLLLYLYLSYPCWVSITLPISKLSSLGVYYSVYSPCLCWVSITLPIYRLSL